MDLRLIQLLLLIMEGLEIVRQFAAELINSRHNQFPMGTIFQSCILANLFVIFVAGEVHSKDRVIVIGAGEFRGSVGDQHLDQLGNVDATSGNYFYSDSLCDVSVLYDWGVLLFGYTTLLIFEIFSGKAAMIAKISLH
jgi:hypothetical protein